MSSDEKIGIAFGIFALFCIVFFVALALQAKKVANKSSKASTVVSTAPANKKKYVWAMLLDVVLIYGVSNFATSYFATQIDSSITGMARSLLTQPYNFVFLYVLFKSLYYGIKTSPASQVFFKKPLTILDIKNLLLLDLVMVVIVIIFN